MDLAKSLHKKTKDEEKKAELEEIIRIFENKNLSSDSSSGWSVLNQLLGVSLFNQQAVT